MHGRAATRAHPRSAAALGWRGRSPPEWCAAWGRRCPWAWPGRSRRCRSARSVRRCARTGRPHPPSGPRRTGPARRVPSGKSTRASPLRSTSSARWSASRSADSRWTGKAPTVSSSLPSHLLLPHLVLRHEEELAVRAEGGEPEVGERAVHRRQDDRPGLGHVLPPDHLGPEPGPQGGDEEAALDPVQRGTPRVDLEGLWRPGAAAPRPAPRPRRSRVMRLLRSQPRQHLLDHILHAPAGRIEPVGVRPPRGAARPPGSSRSGHDGPPPRAPRRGAAAPAPRGRPSGTPSAAASGKTTDPMSRPSTTPPPWASAQARWRLHQLAVAPRGWRPRRRPPCPTSGERMTAGDVLAVDGDLLPHLDVDAAGRGRPPPRCRRAACPRQGQGGHGPVHGARVEPLDAQPLRHGGRDRGLAGAAGPSMATSSGRGALPGAGEALEVLGERRVAGRDGAEPGDQAALARPAASAATAAAIAMR